MKIKFENHSVSGIFREYAGFILNIPGHAIGDKAVTANVPDDLVDDVKRHLTANHPAIVVTVVDAEAEALAAKEAAEKAEAEAIEAERLAQEAAELEAKEAAEKAEAAKASKKGGK